MQRARRNRGNVSGLRSVLSQDTMMNYTTRLSCFLPCAFVCAFFCAFLVGFGFGCGSPPPSQTASNAPPVSDTPSEAKPQVVATSPRIAANAAYDAKEYGACESAFVESAKGANGRAKMNDLYSAACCAALGNLDDKAFPLLHASIEAGFRDVAHLGKDTDLDSLRDDPRWPNVVAAAAKKERESLEGANAELAEIYVQDQGDRMGGYSQIDWSKVGPRDVKRRARVDEILKVGGANTSIDFQHAAMVYQHSDKTADYQRAHELAVKAVELDSSNVEAKWLAAATKDRFLMSSGKPQLYGTQFRKIDGVWKLHDVDPTVTDEERAKWGVPPLAEAKQRAVQMNKQL